MLPEDKPDALGRVIHFASGLIGGIILGVFILAGNEFGRSNAIVVVAASALIFAVLAAWLGDRFWRMVLRFLSW